MKALFLFFLLFDLFPISLLRADDSRYIKTKELGNDPLFANQYLVESSISKAQNDSLKEMAAIKNEVKKKRCNVTTTILIAAIPGYAIHGLGHLYVKRYKAALVLLAIEGLAVLYAYGGQTDIALPLAFGSWIYDLIAAPIICSRMNNKKKRSCMLPYLKNNYYGKKELGIRFSYSF